MSRLIRAVALAFAAVLAVAAAPNWSATYVETDGGHAIGNPQAQTKLIEFVSYTCPHCAHFEEEAGGAIKLAWVQSGKVSVEVRHIIRDPIDLTVAMLTNCGAKNKFFPNHTMFLLSQDEWIARAQAATAAQKQRWSSGPLAGRWRAIASDLGFYDKMATRGYSRIDVDRCLADDAVARRIVDTSEANGTTYGVTGTPSFAVNGKLLDGVHTWDALQSAVNPRLQ